MRTLIYCRASHRSSDARSVTEQEIECRAWAGREGWSVDRVISEEGSASRFGKSTKARSHWVDVVDAIESGDFDILITWEASRAIRDLAVYAELRELCVAAGVLWGYSGTVFDLQDRSDRFRTGLDALLSEDESHRTSERVLRTVRAQARTGQPHGQLPFGYRREYDPATGALLRQVPDEDRVDDAGNAVAGTAPVVVEIFERVAAGESLRRIADDLTRRGVPTPRPHRPGRVPRPEGFVGWSPSSVRYMATSPTYAGRRVHRRVVVGEAAWEPLVSPDLFDTVQGLLGAPDRLTRTGDSRARWLLSGIARCGIPGCGGNVKVIQQRGVRRYTCQWCAKVSRLVEPVDEHVAGRVVAALHHIPVDVDGATEQDQVKAARKERDQLRRRLDGFTDQGAEGKLSPSALARIEARLLPQISALDAKVRQLSAPPALRRVDLDDAATWWEAADLETKRGLLRDAFTVTIYPAGRGRRFDPDLVKVLPSWS